MYSSEHEVQPPVSLLTLRSYKETSEFPELKSAELSEIWRMLDVLSTVGSWARNYPFLKKKSRVESSSFALKAACCEIIRPTVCQLVTSLQALLGSIAWTLSETQAACFYREVLWSLAIAVLHKSLCRGFSHHPADSWV